MSSEQVTTTQGKIISLERPSNPSSDTATADEATTTVGASRKERCFDVLWYPVPGDTWHDTPEEMREATNISRFKYDLLNTHPYESKLELDTQGPAEDTFYCGNEDSFNVNIFFAGIHYLQMAGAPITRVCGRT